jgi:ceramide glucosyltransferase
VIPAVAALGAWAAALVTVQGVAVTRALRARRDDWDSDAPHDLTLVLRPCAGEDPDLAHNLLSTARARWNGPVRVILGVAHGSDPALPACERVAAALRDEGIDARCVVTHAEGANQKVAQLAAMLDRAGDGHTAVLVADSDADLTGLPLGAMVARLFAHERLAAAWVPPVERSAHTAGDRASRAVLGASLHAFPLLAHIDAHGLVGKVFAARADALDAVGGFAALRRHLGEDMELARRWRAAGWRIEAAPFVVPSSAGGRSWTAAAARYGRWVSVIRAQRPGLLASYPALFFGTVPWTVGALAVGVLRPAVIPLLGVAGAAVWGARLAVAAVGARAAGVPWSFRDALRADAMLADAFVRALRSRRFEWRGRTLVILPDGSLDLAG